MSGRYTQRSTWSELVGFYGLTVPTRPPVISPRFNIAPLQDAPIVRIGSDGGRELVMARWGLIPASSHAPDNKNPLINARAETIMRETTFKTAFQRRRCLIPADGFYEWQPAPAGSRQPHFIEMIDGAPFAIAGIWEPWKGPEGPVISFAMVTTSANRVVSRIHDRMPVILHETDWAAWLDVGMRPGEALKMLESYPAEAMTTWRVDTRVTNPANDDPKCIEPVS